MITKIKLSAWLKKYDIWLIMLLAFLVRMIGFRWMGYTDFPEFYRDYYMVSHIAHGTIVLLGPPSMLHGFHFGPFYYYSMLPFYLLFGGRPFSLIFTGIVFSVLTVYAFYKILLLWFNDRAAALTGALFIALSVYSVHLTSYVSNPNFLPLFVLWYFYYLTKVLTNTEPVVGVIPEFLTETVKSSAVKNIRNPPQLFNGVARRMTVPEPGGELDPGSRMHSAGMTHYKNFVFLGLPFGLATQLHATAMIILPLVTITALIVHKYKFRLRPTLIFLLAAIFTYLPYLFYEFTHRFSNFSRLFILGTKELGGHHYGSGLFAIWNFFQGTLTPFNYWYGYGIIQPNILYIVVAVFAMAVLIALLYRIFLNPAPSCGLLNPAGRAAIVPIRPHSKLKDILGRCWIKRASVKPCIKISKTGWSLILSWIFFTCVVLLLFNRGVHDHYIIILWPVPLILLTYAIFWIKAKYNIFASLLALIIVTSLLQIYSFYQFGRTPWSEFMPVYQKQYQNAQGVSEIGS
jgi:hypothetical protein